MLEPARKIVEQTQRARSVLVVERGLDTNCSLLIVIDGAKALHKAVVGCSARRR